MLGHISTAEEWKKCLDDQAAKREKVEEANKAARATQKEWTAAREKEKKERAEALKREAEEAKKRGAGADWPWLLDSEVWHAKNAGSALTDYALWHGQGYDTKPATNIPINFYSNDRLSDDWDYLMRVAVMQPENFDAKELRLRVNEMMYYGHGTGFYYIIRSPKEWHDTFPVSPGYIYGLVGFMFNKAYADTPEVRNNSQLKKNAEEIVQKVIHADFVSPPDEYPGSVQEKTNADAIIARAKNGSGDGDKRREMCEIYRDLQKDPIGAEGYKSGKWGAKLGAVIGRAIYCS
ncbi:hypothetical protein ACFWP3_38110 [Streptomyces sp. NPDC058525]|uniref:hypothetical protein n=1 Tax=Streptomyces sp. NPDC058525 TaxID=3346538 RepID=UPI003669FC0F